MKKLFLLSTIVIFLVAGCAGYNIDPNDPNAHVIQGIKRVVQGPMQCGPASMTAVLNYYGIDVSLKTVDDAIRNKPYGTPFPAMMAYPYKHGLKAEVFYEDDIEEMKSYLSEDKPIIFRRSCPFCIRTMCHYMVIIGYTSKGFIILCPKQGQYHISYSRYLKWDYCHLFGMPLNLVILKEGEVKRKN